MVAENYFADFEFYRARGQIGPAIWMQILTPNPPLGGICQIQFHTDDEIVFARLPRYLLGQPYFRVLHHSQIQIPLSRDEPFQISLVDQSGTEIVTETITPFVAIPQISQLILPPKINYADVALSVEMQTQNVHNTVVHCRKAGTEDWDLIPADQFGFSIPLPTEICQLEIRLQLHSIHAHLTERACLTMFRSIEIIHPEPTVCIEQSEAAVTRFSDAVCTIRAEWATRIALSYCNTVLERNCLPGERIIDIALPINTQELSQQQIQIQLFGRDGIIRHFVHKIEILPRPVTLLSAQNRDGSVSFDLAGGTDLTLYIPSRGVELALDSDSGEIVHAFHWPTPAQLRCLDDRNVIHSTDIELGPPVQPWSPLPVFTELPGWRN